MFATAKLNPVSLLLAAFLLCLAVAPGCRKAPEGDPQDTLPITGRPTDPAVELKARWQPGTRYLVFVQTAQSSTGGFRRAGAGGRESTLSQDYSVTVSETPRRGRSLDFEIQSLAVTVVAGDQTVLFFDSLNTVTPSQGPGVEALEGLLGKHLKIQLQTDGTFQRMDGVRELLDLAGSGGGGGGRGLGGVQRFLAPGYFRQITEFAALPAKAVRVGERWTATRELQAGLGGLALLNTTNTFVGWQERDKHKCARIDFAGTLAARPALNRPAPGGMTLTDGNLQGRLWLDPELGFPVEMAWEQSGSVTGPRPNRGPRAPGTNAPAAGPNADGEKVTMPLHETFLFKLKELQPGAGTPATP